MAAFLVGGVECLLEETQVTFGHLAIPLREIVAFGVANESSELVVVYERRAEESGYRETRGAVRTRATTTLALHGEHDLVIAWLRQRMPERWRGYEEAVAHIVEGPPGPEPESPVGWARTGIKVGVFVLLAFVGTAVIAYAMTRPPPPEMEKTIPLR